MRSMVPNGGKPCTTVTAALVISLVQSSSFMLIVYIKHLQLCLTLEEVLLSPRESLSTFLVY